MKKLLIFLLFLWFFLSSGLVSIAEENVVRMSYVCRDLAGVRRWQADTEIRGIRPGTYLMIEKAEGLYSSFNGRISWVAEMEFESAGDTVRPIRLEKRIFDERGDMIRFEKQEFDLLNNTAVCIHEEPLRKISRTRKFKFDKDVVNRLSLGLYAQKFLESGKANSHIQMVSEEPNVYDIELKYLGKEMIEINGRIKTAYRLCIDPELKFLNFIKIFLPKAYAWHSAEPEYELLRYSGLEGGINSKKVEVTVLNYDGKTF